MVINIKISSKNEIISIIVNINIDLVEINEIYYIEKNISMI